MLVSQVSSPGNSATYLVLMPHRQFVKYLLNTGKHYGLAAQHIPKTLYRSIFDTYQQSDYSLRSRTACCTEFW